MKTAIPFLAVLIPLLTAARAQDYPVEKEAVLAIGRLTDIPGTYDAEGTASGDNLRALFYDGLPWRGKPTRVFAWLGMPERRGEETVPGVVLVHGGGGTAFKEWVRKWNDHGFAAISIAVEGQLDVRSPENPRAWQRHPWPGPSRNGIFGDSDAPLADQWIYHAVADTVLARLLLASLPEVDGDSVGLMGTSWGGVVTSTVMGTDDRFAFAVPVYGCGSLAGSANQYGAALGDNLLYRKVWDPVVRMDRATMPALWLSWPGDQHFPLDAQAACYQAAPGPRTVSLIPGLRHGHEVAWDAPDSYAFAKSVVHAGRPWCRQLEAAVEGATATVRFRSANPLHSAVLVTTPDTGFTGNRTWTGSPATLTQTEDAWRASAPVPPGTTAWFLNVRSGDLTVSSDYQTVE